VAQLKYKELIKWVQWKFLRFCRLSPVEREFPEGCEVAEGALVGALEAGFVAIQHLEFGALGELREGQFEAFEFADWIPLQTT
jgi:hypothetical protein